MPSTTALAGRAAAASTSTLQRSAVRQHIRAPPYRSLRARRAIPRGELRVNNPDFSRILPSNEVHVVLTQFADLELDAMFLVFHANGDAAILILDMQRTRSQRYMAESLRSGFGFLVASDGKTQHYRVRATVENPNFNVSANVAHLDGMASRPPGVDQRAEFLTLAQCPPHTGTAIAMVNGVRTRGEVFMNPVFDEEAFPSEEDILRSQWRPLRPRMHHQVFRR